MKNVFLAIAIGFLLAFIWLGRFSIYTIRPDTPVVYKFDRWTGKMTVYILYNEYDTQK